MAERVAEVQDHPHARFAFVRLHDLRLDLAGPRHRVTQRVRIPGKQSRQVFFDPVEEVRVEDDAVLDHFRQAGAQFALGQRVEGVEVRDHATRLVEGADQILAAGVVDRGLAAYGGVHQREQGRRNLDVGDAALVGGRGEAGNISHHPSAERDDRGAAVVTPGDQPVDDVGERREGLERLAVRKRHDVCPNVFRQARQGAVQVVGADHVVGHDESLVPGQEAVEQVRLAEQATADPDRIGPFCEVDRNRQGVRLSRRCHF